MRLVIAVLILLTLYLQYSLWYTRGGIQDVDKLKAAVAEQKDEIAQLKERNRSLSAEVIDLKQGLEAIEERARSEMGMIKNGEVFFRITDPNHQHDNPALAAGASAARGAGGADGATDPFAEGDAPDIAEDKTAEPRPLVKPAVPANAPKAAVAATKPVPAAPKPASSRSTSSTTPKAKPAATASSATTTKPRPAPTVRKPAPVE